MRYLIVGGNGTIGYALAKHLAKDNDVIITYLSRRPETSIKALSLDIRDSKATLAATKTVAPDVVIHCSALTNVDLCETDHALADAINVNGTANVIAGCKETGARLVYVSTAAVFDGSKKVYVESDAPNTINYYAYTKLKGEQLCQQSGLNPLILRTDQPYGLVEPWHKTNTVLRTVEKLTKDEITKEPDDWYNNPTYTPDFVSAVVALLEKKESGIFHVVGPDYLNRYEWAMNVADVFGLDKSKIVAVKGAAFNLPAKRQCVNLSIEKLRELGVNMHGVMDGARSMKKLIGA